jgi:hypothetical protein
MKVNMITFLEFHGQDYTYHRGQESLRQYKIHCEIRIDLHYLAKRMKDGCTKSLAKSQGEGTMITKTQGVYLVRVGDTQVIPGRKEWTQGEHGNACDQQALTKWQTYYGQVRTSCSIETPRITFLFLVTYLK